MTQSNIYTAVESKLRDLMSEHNVGGHGVDHMVAVMEHAKAAVVCENLPNYTKEKIVLAALLHDSDDHKIFKDNIGYNNAYTILCECLTPEFLLPLMEHDPSNSNFISGGDGTVTSMLYKYSFIKDVIKLIDLVSCSKNGDSDPDYPWMAIPRDCDRLEAIGEIGIHRCDEYSTATNAPDFTPETVRVYTEEELWKVATPDRFAKYKKSISKIDHYYDKLLHIGKPECLKSQNTYILEEATRRNTLMVKYVLDFWNQIPSNI